MVFCGKPSKGCSSCRKRRIKCDQIRPACSQCLRSAKICEGYRDQLDLSFRNENEKVVSKVRLPLQPAQTTLSKHQKDTTATRTSGDTALQSFQTLVLDHIKPAGHLPYSPDNDQGINFFFTTYVEVLLDYGAANPVTAFTRAIPWQDLYFDGSLFNAVSSVGFAGLANITKDQKYAVLARRRFSVAANTINNALKNTGRADLESVFKSVMLLSAFQLVSDPLSSSSWSVHVEGGAALLQIMDRKKSRDIPIRQQLKLCLSVFVDYIAKEQPCSPNVLKWCNTCSDSIEPDDRPAVSLTRLLIKFTHLNASMTQLVSVDSAAFVKQAIALDDEMELWEKQLPASWLYEVLSTSIADPASGFKEDVLKYRDLWTARIWSDYRWARISINGLIIRHSFKHDFMLVGDAARVCRALQINSKMAKGICNSISNEFNKRHQVVLERKFKGPVLRGTFLILHPLSVAARGIGVPEEVHLFAINLLMTMGNTMGIRQAIELAEASIKKRQEWKILLKDWVE